MAVMRARSDEERQVTGTGVEPGEADGEGEGAGGVGAGERVPTRAVVEAFGRAAPGPEAGAEDVGAGAAAEVFKEIGEHDGEEAGDGDGEGAAAALFVDEGDGEDDQGGAGAIGPIVRAS